MERKRILTGERTTGRLHLGHYAGSLENRVRLQKEYDLFVILADIQALTTHFEQTDLVRDSVVEVVLDNLAAGLEPGQVTFLQQSRVPAIAELTVFFSMLVSVQALQHNPTIKTEAKQYGMKGLSYGFLGYPVSQTADIAFCRAGLVPVGQDQLPHLEQSRKLIRRFHALYGPVFPLPEALLSQVPRLPGLDGDSKMGKSLGNAVYLSDTAEIVAEKVGSAFTDPARLTAREPGHPDSCVAAAYYRAFCPDLYGNVCELCRAGAVGCRACKTELAGRLNSRLAPIRERRGYYEQRRGFVLELVDEGSKKSAAIGRETVGRTREAMGLVMG